MTMEITMDDKLKAEYLSNDIDIQRLYARDMKHDYYLCKYISTICYVYLQIHRNTKYVRFFLPEDFHILKDKKRIFILPIETEY